MFDNDIKWSNFAEKYVPSARISLEFRSITNNIKKDSYYTRASSA